MTEISYRRHRFPLIVIQHAVWLYLRFTLSYRDVEDLLAELGLDISYETIRSWVLKFACVGRIRELVAGHGTLSTVAEALLAARSTNCRSWRSACDQR
jgi:putative transposase